MNNTPHSRFPGPLLLLLLVGALPLAAEPLDGLGGTEISAWSSIATGTDLTRFEYVPATAEAGKAQPTVIYLLNLAAPRVGTDSDEAIVADFLTDGYVVITLDYANDPAARCPTLNPDILKMREEVLFNNYTSTYTIDQNSLFLVPSGHRIARNIMYESTGWKRGMDLIYPSNPAFPVGAIMEFSCDNANRMGNYSMFAIRDTLFEGAATEGFAVAMADHPKPLSYDGIDPMPDSARKVKAAVRTLRAQAETYGLSGEIVTLGFSRGSGMALMAATTFETDEFDGFYEYQEVDDSVQGAIILSGRFTYLDLLPDDKNLSKYVSYWGPKESNFEKWKAQGALDYLESATPYPFFLELNSGEAIDEDKKSADKTSDAMHQMNVLMARFDELGIQYTFRLEEVAVGHKMPIEPLIVNEMLSYLKARLRPAPESVVASMQLSLEGDETSNLRWHTMDPVPPNDYRLEALGDSWATVDTLFPDEQGMLSFEASENQLYRIVVDTNIDPVNTGSGE